MAEGRTEHPIIHFVGSIPLPDAETVFRTLAESAGPSLRRLPDGETGIRKTWIRFLQEVLAQNPAIEPAHDIPPLTQLGRFEHFEWSKCLRSLRWTPEGRHYSGAGGAGALAVILGCGWAGRSSFSLFSKRLSSGSGSV